MSIVKDETTQTWSVAFYRRHPITRKPKRMARRGLKTLVEAKRVYAELVALIDREFAHPTGTMLYSDVLSRFYDSLLGRDLTQKTIENYVLCLNAHTLPLWRSRAIDSIRTEEIRNLIKTGLGHRSPSHQKTLLKFVRGVFTFAVEEGILQRNPVPRLQFRIGDKIKRVLTEQQLSIFLDQARRYDHEWYSIWCFAVYTGCRNGEIHALTWDKVYLEDRKILISCSWNKKDGHKDLTKSGSDRIVEISPPLLTVLRELKLASKDSVYVLPRITAWDEGRQAEVLRMFLTGISLPQVRFHDLRASWATAMLGKGVQAAMVMKMGGWTDLKTMMIYVRKAGIDIKGITDNLILHDPSARSGTLVQMPGRSNS